MKFVDVATRPEAGAERTLGPHAGVSAASLPRPQIEHDALLRVAAAAAGASGLDDVLELAAEEARTAVGAASLSVSRWEAEIGAIRTLLNVGDLGPDEERYPAEEVYPADEYPAVREMVRHGSPYFNSVDDKHADPQAIKVLRALGKSSDLGVPIVVEGDTWGEIWATKAIGEPPFRAEDINFLEAIAGQFATAIARAELFSRVSRLAYEDALTGLPNRRAFEERLERSVQRSRASEQRLAMLICDLDKLKQINDSRGHEAGDQALRSAGEALVAAAADRPGCFVARLAGDEFCVLLEGHALADAEAVGVAAIEAVESAGRAIGLSLSCGAAKVTAATRTPSDLLSAADRALYAAKRRGGGQVCSASEGPGASLPRRRLRDEATVAEPVAAATEALVAELDGPLAEAPILDRLEAVCSAYTAAADLASWTVSLATPGDDLIADLSMGNNRDGDYQGIRVGPGTNKYRLSQYPSTAGVIAAGSGVFIASRSAREGDPAERELLVELGFDSVIGVAAAAEEGVYLIELYGDHEGDRLAKLATPLRLAARAAVPPRAGRGRSVAATFSGSDLSLSVARRLGTAVRPETAGEIAADELQRAFGCHIVHAVMLEDDTFKLIAERGPGRTGPGWSQRSDVGLIGRCLREQQPVLAADVRREPQFRGNEATRGVRSELVVPVRAGGRIWGAINLEHTVVDFFDADDVRLVEAIAAQLGGALHALQLYASLERAYVGTAEALSAVLEAKDPRTAQHSNSIARRAVEVGRHLGMEEADLQMLRLGAAFHDIGKIGIPRSVLYKPGPLTATERTMVEQHTVIGERILAPIEFLEPILPMVRHAHERWDGRGYPDGLAGEEIPFGARVLFACDAHDAMSTDRPYRAALPEQKVRSELREGAGSQFDPDVVEALLAVLDAGG